MTLFDKRFPDTGRNRSPTNGPDAARRFLLLAGCWVICVLVAKEAWYRMQTTDGAGRFQWTIALPKADASFQPMDLPPRTVRLLKCDLSRTGKWREPDGSEWSVFFFRWNPTSVQSIINARNHRPDVCLPASGWRQVSASEPVWFEAAGLKLPFRTYVYAYVGLRLFVFFCQWEDGAVVQSGLPASKQAGRIRAAFAGRRHVGQQTLEIIVTGYANLKEAQTAFRKRLPHLIVADPDSNRSVLSAAADGK